MHELGPEVKTIEVVRAIIVNDAGLVLMLQRPANDRRRPNEWEFVGGKKDDPEESDNDTVLRETSEESRQTIQVVSPFFEVERKVITDGKEKGSTYLAKAALARVKNGSPAVQISHEHQQAGWFIPLDVVPSQLTHTTIKIIENWQLFAPYIHR